jgi:hypothetical protein
MAAITIYTVEDGSYEDRTILAAFQAEADAEAFANHQARTTAYWSEDDLPRVSTLEFYPTGAWHPGCGQVIDGELVTSLEINSAAHNTRTDMED